MSKRLYLGQGTDDPGQGRRRTRERTRCGARERRAAPACRALILLCGEHTASGHEVVESLAARRHLAMQGVDHLVDDAAEETSEPMERMRM